MAIIIVISLITKRKSREFHELREKVDGKLYNYTGELI